MRGTTWRLSARADDRILFGNPERRARMVDEAPLVFQQFERGRTAFWRRRRLQEVVQAVPPQLCDAVIRLRRPAIARHAYLQLRVVQRVRLNVTADAQRLRVAAYERPMLLQPVLLKLGERKVRQPAQAEDDLDHATPRPAGSARTGGCSAAAAQHQRSLRGRPRR